LGKPGGFWRLCGNQKSRDKNQEAGRDLFGTGIDIDGYWILVDIVTKPFEGWLSELS
jgi:hypothetical protein